MTDTGAPIDPDDTSTPAVAPRRIGPNRAQRRAHARKGHLWKWKGGILICIECGAQP